MNRTVLVICLFVFGMALCCSAVEAGGQTGDPHYRWQRKDGSTGLLRSDRVVWRLNYRKEEGKPYFHPLCLPDGTRLTWNRPPDHAWHHGLWFSWRNINGVNYWSENPKTHRSSGRTEVVDVEVETRDDRSARIDMTIRYHPADEPTVLLEHRTLSVSPPAEDGGYHIDWDSTFVARQKARLGRVPPPHEEEGKSWGGFAGLTLRMAENTLKWRIFDSKGRRDREGFHGKKAPWAVFSVFSDKTERAAHIAILGHPSNPRHPTPWFIVNKMKPVNGRKVPMGFLNAAFLWGDPLTLEKGERLRLRYRMAVRPGRADKEEVNKLWRAYRN